jgi:hypothetical protein
MMPLYLRDAEERGDVYAQRCLRAWRGNTSWLIADRPDEARANLLAGSIPRGPDDPPQLSHYYEMLSHTHIDLYTGDALAAHQRVEAGWRDLRRSLLLRIQTVAIEGWFLRGRAALAAWGAGGGDGKALARLVQLSTKKIDAQDMPYGAPLAELLRATRDHLSDRPEKALVHLRAAAEHFDAVAMKLYAAVTRKRMGQLLGGDEGAALIRAADELLCAEAVVSPERLTAMLTPGWRP